MLHNSQINRLLTSIVASMVVLSAVATVEVQLPQSEIEVIARQLCTSYDELMSDRAGQEALNRLLRQQSPRQVKQSSSAHEQHAAASACVPEQARIAPDYTQSILYVPSGAPLATPVAASPVKIRAPSSI